MYENYLHVNILLEILRKAQISLDDFFSLDLPNKFINCVLEKKSRLDQKNSCPTPWCKGRFISGTLRRTATSSKTKKDGTKQNYYMVCLICGIEYCLSEKKLIERGYFTTLAYKKILPRIKSTSSIKQLADELHTTKDKVKRSIIFLMANELVDNDLIIKTVSVDRNEKVVEAIIREVNNGTRVKSIPKKLGLKHSEFLYYWFSPEVRVAYLLPKKIKRTVKNLSEEYILTFRKAISCLSEQGRTITIKNVSNELKVCSETLRNWGLLPEIQNAKIIQKQKTKEENKQRIIKNAKQIIISGMEINCESLYVALRLNRTSVWRSNPELAKVLSNMVKELAKNI